MARRILRLAEHRAGQVPALAVIQGPRAAATRDLRVVLFTDIVGSTDRAASLGDRAWGELLARHHADVRAALRATGGREVDTAGDGFFATFARPTEALACARQIVEGVRALGLSVRVGVHAGEVETFEGKASGITVHEAARLSDAADPDEILVSATVHELVAGAGWTFRERGPLRLKGLAEPVNTYALDLEAPPPVFAGESLGLNAALRGGRWAIGAGSLVVLLAAVLVAVSLGGGAGNPGAAPTASAGASSLSAAASPTSSAAPTPGEIPICGLCYGPPFAPGRYTAAELPGTPTLTLTDGWSVYWSIGPDLALARTSSPTDRLWIDWPDSLPKAGDMCGLQGDSVDIGPSPEAQFLVWARANKGLQLSAGIARRFGDLLATDYDVSVVDRYACQYTTPPSIAVAAVSLNAGERLRLGVSSRDGKLILILIEAPTAAEFDSFDPLAEQVLGTLDFTP